MRDNAVVLINTLLTDMPPTLQIRYFNSHNSHNTEATDREHMSKANGNILWGPGDQTRAG